MVTKIRNFDVLSYTSNWLTVSGLTGSDKGGAIQYPFLEKCYLMGMYPMQLKLKGKPKLVL